MTKPNLAKTKATVAKNVTSAKNKAKSFKQSVSNGATNLKVNYNKFYETAKINTRLVLNTGGHALLGLGLVNLVFSFGAPLFLVVAGGVALVKTIKHAKKTNEEILTLRKAIKAR